MKPIAVIIGVGDGLSASLARLLAPDYALHLAARSTDRTARLAAELGATAHQLDATDPDAVDALFDGLSGPPRVAVYNPSRRLRGSVAELDPEAVRQVIDVTAYGAFLMGRAAARAMLAAPPVDGVKGTILFTGASAGEKGFPLSAPFAMGKFAQRGLAQSMARELHPKGIHVAWINIDGGIRNPGTHEPAEAPASMLDPDAIARAYVGLIGQDRSTWTNELTLRPWVERF